MCKTHEVAILNSYLGGGGGGGGGGVGGGVGEGGNHMISSHGLILMIYESGRQKHAVMLTI